VETGLETWSSVAERSDEVGNGDSGLTDLRLFHDCCQRLDTLARRLGWPLVGECPA